MAVGREDIQQAREKDKLRKDKMKEYRDAGRNVRPHNIQQGDLILLKRKTTKHSSMYDPDPYLAVKVEGTQITGIREGHRDKTRDAQRWKRYEATDTVLQPVRDEPPTAEDLDIGAGPNFREKEMGPRQAARQVTGAGHDTEQQREQRQEPAQPQGPRNRLHRPWQEAQAAQVPRQGRTGMRTQLPRQAKATYTAVVRSRKETDDPADRHRLRDPVVGAWGDPNRRTADRGTR